MPVDRKCEYGIMASRMLISIDSEEYRQHLDILTDTVASEVRTGVSFRDAFGKAFRNSEIYDPEILNMVRIQVGSILRARQQKHPIKNRVVIPSQQDLFPTSPLPQYPD